VPRRRRFNPHRLFRQIKLLAFEAALTIVFLYWLGKSVAHEIGLDGPPAFQPVQVDVCGADKR